MNRRSSVGFTIIETILFLGISGALAAAILAGSSIAISQQRYRDAGSTLQAFFQRQYTNVSNVVNIRDNNWTCDAQANVIEIESSGLIAGASECVIMGKLIRITDNGQTVVSSDVIGRQYAYETVTNDIDALKQYRLAWTSVGQERKTVDWGASLARPASEGGSIESTALLVLRSPFSGVMRTFSPEGYTPGDAQYTIPASVISSFNTKQTLCLNSPDFTVFQRLALVVQARATGPTSIELFGEGSGC